MTNVLSFAGSIVPVSRFNRGEAAKIFEELKKSGTKVVMKNNAPVSVIMSPDEYERLMEEREDMELLLEALSRMKNPANQKTYTIEELMEQNGITAADIDKAEEPEIGRCPGGSS